MLEKRLFKNVDYAIIVAVSILLFVSIIMVTSATQPAPGQDGDPYYFTKRQVINILIGIAAFLFMIVIDYNNLRRFARVIYIASLLSLVAVLLIGKEGGLGGQSWIYIGSFGLQPSEFAKVALIISLAAYLSDKDRKISRWQDLIFPFIHVGIPLLLILKQPDLGTALVLISILFGMLFMSGTPLRYLFSIIGAGIAALPLAWQYLDKYQQNRLLVFLDPNRDPLGAGYHVIQSRIAIGSGGLIGKGIFEGTQNKLKFLPEQHTDFIFSVIGEEMGFIGSMLILIIYLFVIYRGLKIAVQAKDQFGTLMAVGVVSMFLFHILENIGMTIGVMPVTGIPLPFMSYGGSSMLTNMMALGILINVNMRRQKIMF